MSWRFPVVYEILNAVAVSCLILYHPSNRLSSELVDVRVTSREQRSVTSREMMPDYYDVVMNVSGRVIETTLERKDVVEEMSGQDYVYKRDWATYASSDVSGVFVVRRHEHYPGSVTVEGYFLHKKTPYSIHSLGPADAHVIHKLSEPFIESDLRTTIRRFARSPTSSPPVAPTAELYLKLQVWADLEMRRIIKTRMRADMVLDYIQQYYAMLIMSIDQAFQSLRDQGTNIHCRGVGLHTEGVPGIEKLEHFKVSDFFSKIKNAITWSGNGSELLDFFRQFLLRSSGQFDHALLLTGYELVDDAGKDTINGIAFQNAVCSASSVSVIQFDFQMNNFAAHEIAHSLGALHDGDKNNCIAKRCKASENFVMAPAELSYSRKRALNWWNFSPCSNELIRKLVEEKSRKIRDCLARSGHMEPLPGEYFYGNRMSRDQQCRMMSGKSRGTYVARKNEGEMCEYGMKCRFPAKPLSRMRVYMPYPGTQCGHNKWCVGKRCELRKQG